MATGYAHEVLMGDRACRTTTQTREPALGSRFGHRFAGKEKQFVFYAVKRAVQAPQQLSRHADADGTLMSHFLPAQGRGAVPARCCSNWSESNPPTPWNMVLRTRTHAKPPTNITGHRCSPSKESEARLHECEAWSGEVICVFESAPMCATDENLEMGRPRLDAAFS